ncbi:glyoxalase [Intrasporangium chromatireducens Q5-1]|uniref:Glyoxalase n=1 Tax=Intrasporangium chromatireducens Q5-1 TaxID=584657 RepID=W9GQS4_9MICO|nr:VOC family protein [Intrasporangium chromatireducens]EWT07173.1 glyoxalase [Intrasporangium chromatireducens Q5-1]
MEQRISLITLGVSDLGGTRRFYEEGLGWERGNAHDDVAFYQLPGMVLALWDREALAADAGVALEPTGFAGITIAYNTRSRDEVDEVLRRFAAAGGTVTKPAVEAEWGGYSGYGADPDGHLWEVAWNPGWTVTDDGRTVLD